MLSIKKFRLVSYALLLMLTACQSLPSGDMGSSGKENVTAANYNVQLGIAYLRQGDVQRAKRKLLSALGQAPNWAPAQDAMGYYLMNTGEMESAEAYFLRAIKIDAQAGAPHNNYGIYLCRSKRYAEADQQFLLAVSDPNYLNMAEAYENAGLCALLVPDAAKGEKYFFKALEQDPQRAPALLELAKLNIKQGQIAQAQSYLARYRRVMGNDAASAELARQLSGKLPVSSKAK